MDGLDLDDMVAGVNKTGEQAKKDKNAQVQLMKKVRDDHYSVTKVVIRDDPVAKTAEDLFRALAKNTHIESVNLKNVKLTVKSLELLAEALKTNKTLHTLILNCVCPSDGFTPVVKVLESDNTTLHTLHVFQGPNKFFESSLEKMFKDRLTNK
jgi:Ran GTPase-activating protein (RanGAP) involved in mRNA processing and transport